MQKTQRPFSAKLYPVSSQHDSNLTKKRKSENLNNNGILFSANNHNIFDKKKKIDSLGLTTECREKLLSEANKIKIQDFFSCRLTEDEKIIKYLCKNYIDIYTPCFKINSLDNAIKTEYLAIIESIYNNNFQTKMSKEECAKEVIDLAFDCLFESILEGIKQDMKDKSISLSDNAMQEIKDVFSCSFSVPFLTIINSLYDEFEKM